MDGPLACLTGGRTDCVFGRGVVFTFIESLDLGILGVANGLGVLAEVSEIGGEGGVGASDGPEDVDLVGGVCTFGEDAVVPCDRSDLGDCGTGICSRAIGRCARFSSAC